MACLARSVSGCTSCHAARTLQWAQGSIVSPSSIRLYALCQPVKQEFPKYCFIKSRNVASAFSLADRFRASPSNVRFSGLLRFSTRSEGGDRRKELQTLECMNSRSADVSYERRRQKYLEKLACPGCGVYMQDKDPNRPGYFKMPALMEKTEEDVEEELDMDAEFEGRAELDDSDFDAIDEDEDEEDEEDMDMDTRLSVATEWNEVGGDSRQAGKDAWAEILGGKYRPKKDDGAADEEEDEEKVVVCARCHALRNYGKVKDESLENLLPDFDFERVVGARLKKAYGRRAVVLMVVDGSDFDGSFPRKAAEVLAEADEELGTAWQEGKAGNTPRFSDVVTFSHN